MNSASRARGPKARSALLNAAPVSEAMQILGVARIRLGIFYTLKCLSSKLLGPQGRFSLRGFDHLKPAHPPEGRN
jgi:hypothetical protein